jgi:uncharacterized membrane protein
MTGMWDRWARERRTVGLGHLALTATAGAVAVLLLTIGLWPFAILMTIGTIAMLILAVHEFWWAHKYQKLAG